MAQSHGLCLPLGQTADKTECQLQPSIILHRLFGKIYHGINIHCGVSAAQHIDAAPFHEHDAPRLTVGHKAQLFAVVPEGDKTILHHVGRFLLVVEKTLGHALHGGLQRQIVGFELFCFAVHAL